jgi:hypothetical protein
VSTKIHHGYRLDCTRLDLMTLPTVLRAAFGPTYETEYLLASIRAAAFLVDQRRVEKAASGVDYRLPKVSAMYATDWFLRVGQSKIDETGRRMPPIDFAVDVTLLPDIHSGDLYALLFTERQAYRDVWESLSWVTPYPYWDSTDRPDGVSASEWARRAAAWDRVLPSSTAPATAGLSWSLIAQGNHTVCGEDLIAADPLRAEFALPSKADRAREIARCEPGLAEGCDAEPGTGAWLDHVLAATAVRAAEILPTVPDITIDDLLATPGES